VLALVLVQHWTSTSIGAGTSTGTSTSISISAGYYHIYKVKHSIYVRCMCGVLTQIS
jgi:hypothetical protein